MASKTPKEKPLEQRLGRAQVDMTIKALLTHIENKRKLKAKAQLLPDADVISVIVALNKTPQKGKNKPVFVSIPHPMRPKSTTICLFAKDNSVAKLKESLREKAPTLHCKVIGLSKLRKNYHEHSAKRELCAKYDLFLADDRIVAMLSKPLGRSFFRKKKQPVPVSVGGSRATVVRRIERVRDNTHMYTNWGNCCAVRVASSEQSHDEIVDNILDGTAVIVSKLPGKWQGIQAIHVKTADSIALPLFHSVAHLDKAADAEADKASEPTAKSVSAKQSGKRRRGEKKKDSEKETKQSQQ